MGTAVLPQGVSSPSPRRRAKRKGQGKAPAIRQPPPPPAAPPRPWYSGRPPPTSSCGAGAGTWAGPPPTLWTQPPAPTALPPPAPWKLCRAERGMLQSLGELPVTPAGEKLGLGGRGTSWETRLGTWRGRACSTSRWREKYGQELDRPVCLNTDCGPESIPAKLPDQELQRGRHLRHLQPGPDISRQEPVHLLDRRPQISRSYEETSGGAASRKK